MPYKNKDDLRKFQREWKAARRQAWIDSQGAKCIDCNSTERLEVDHVDPSQKLMRPSLIWSLAEANPKRIAELAKCVLRCHDCHQVKTKRQRAGRESNSPVTMRPWLLKEAEVLVLQQ